MSSLHPTDPQSIGPRAVGDPAKLSPELYPFYKRRLGTIRILQKVRSLGDALGGSRWLAAGLAGAMLFVATTLLGIVLPWGIGVQLVLALLVSGSTFGVLLGMMHAPPDALLNAQGRAIEQVLPDLKKAWIKHLEEQAKAREAERARQAAEAERIAAQALREAEARVRQAEAARERQATQRQQAYRQSGTAICMFDNQTDTPALVKLKGPVEESVQVASGSVGSITSIPAGRYIIRVRYGTSEANYSYTEGDPFPLEDHALCKITLHKVVGGNYGSRSIGKGNF
jgi:hypothetical protein